MFKIIDAVGQEQSNFDVHFTSTGPEIWRQVNGSVHAFVAGAGAPPFSLLFQNLLAQVPEGLSLGLDVTLSP